MKPRPQERLLKVGLGLIGPLLALLITWFPPLAITRVELGVLPTQLQVERLREMPSDRTLAEINSFAVGRPTEWIPSSVTAIAGEALRGKLELPHLTFPVDIPFDPQGDVLGYSSREFNLCLFAVPDALAAAYSESGDLRFLDAAIRYVLDWSEFEARLWLPRGYVFNDHALASRAIVVAEIWRLYRQSPRFEYATGIELLSYVQRLASLLQKHELYNYNTNHGVMHSLALMHLAVAFPELPDVKAGAEIGRDRFLAQYPYYINEEGVVLEHSAEYHFFGMQALAAAQNYFGLLGVSAPADLLDRFQRGSRFLLSLHRPDDTLPPFGDTHDDLLYTPLRHSVDPRIEEFARPDEITLTPAAGYAVIWRDRERRPNVDTPSQVVISWANFPTSVHKHADDLGVSLWAGGVQWIRSVGYWPYSDQPGRESAIGWRSSNAPHWVDESPAVERANALLASVRDDDVVFLEVSRTNAVGPAIHRQFVQLAQGVLLTLDSFESPAPQDAEVIWRSSPGVILRPMGSSNFLLEKAGAPVAVSIGFAGIADWKAEADIPGAAAWNSGVISAGRVTKSPAVRLTSSGAAPVLLSAIQLHESAGIVNRDPEVRLTWHGPDQWSAAIEGSDSKSIVVTRAGSQLSLTGSHLPPGSWTIRDELHRASTLHADQSARMALAAATSQFGNRFEPMLERRTKVAAAIAFFGVIQVLILLLAQRRSAWPWLVSLATVCWIALAAFLHLEFLA